MSIEEVHIGISKTFHSKDFRSLGAVSSSLRVLTSCQLVFHIRINDEYDFTGETQLHQPTFHSPDTEREYIPLVC